MMLFRWQALSANSRDDDLSHPDWQRAVKAAPVRSGREWFKYEPLIQIRTTWFKYEPSVQEVSFWI